MIRYASSALTRALGSVLVLGALVLGDVDDRADQVGPVTTATHPDLRATPWRSRCGRSTRVPGLTPGSN